MTPKQAAKLYTKTKSVRSVMQRVGCSFYTAKQLISDGGGELLGPRRKSKLTKKEMIDLYKTKGIREIAELNGTSPNIVIRVLHEAKVKMRSRGNNEIRVSPTTHGHCQAAKACGMTPYRYVRVITVLHLGGKCRSCGTSDLRVLDVNHINGKDCPQKKPGHTTNLKYKEHLKILAGESMEHIEVLCCNCNRIHEYERRNFNPLPEEFYAYTGTNRSFYDRPDSSQ
jgi:transposase-like protein